MFTILNSRQSLHFSAAHMTIFQDGTKEALHGHNYQLGYEISQTESKYDSFLDFSIPKKLAQTTCDFFDEKVIVAKSNPLQKITESDNEIEIRFGSKRYVLPRDEVVLLDADNVTTETLAFAIFGTMRTGLLAQLKPQDKILKTLDSLKITVWESKGQGASYIGKF